MKRKTTSKFQINGVPMMTPDVGVEIGVTDLISSDSGRDESGFTHNIVLRSEVHTWTFRYAWLTAEEYAYVRQLLRGNHEFDFTFPNEKGETKTVKAYCIEKRAAYWSSKSALYKDMQFEIVEC